MRLLLSVIVTGAVAFASANVDDIVVLTLFFSQVNATFRRWHVVLGQYIGFTVLVVFSLLASLGALVVPKTWIGLLGLLPIGMGIAYLVRKRRMQPHAEHEVEAEQLLEKMQQLQQAHHTRSFLARLLNPQIYAISAVTIANGADNVGIFTPLFASSGLARLLVIIGVFYIGVGVYLYIGSKLARDPATVRVLERYGDLLVPLILIGLGIYILIDSNTLSLLPWFHP